MPTIPTPEVIANPFASRRRPEHLDGGHDGLTEERVDIAPPQRRKFEPTLSPYTPDQYRQHPDWNRVLWKVSEAAREAFIVLDRECDALQAALDDLADLPAEQQAEAREVERQVAAAIAGGKKAPTPKTTDWAAREVALTAEARVRLERCRVARQTYAETVQAELAPSLARLAGELEPMRQKALAAWGQAEQPLRAWRAAVSTADLIAERLAGGDDPSGTTTEENRRVRSQGIAGLSAVSALLGAADPVVSGRRHTEPSELAVPLYTREAWANGSSADVARLAEQEALIDSPPYSVSAWTEREYRHLLLKPAL